MKIEMGESIVYSWLKHVKGCQIVQNNWKAPSSIKTSRSSSLTSIFDDIQKSFSPTYNVFKKTKNIEQLLLQAECDAVGYDFDTDTVYGVDVAFHRSGGLDYGSRTETVAKVICKCARTALCFLDCIKYKNVVVLFASPKIGKAKLDEIMPCIDKLTKIFNKYGYFINFEIIANDDFKNKILDPIMIASPSIDDTSELFLRSYQLIELYYSIGAIPPKHTTAKTIVPSTTHPGYKAYKIGQLVQTVLFSVLQTKKVTKKEINDLQTQSYSKNTFGIRYPLLVEKGKSFDRSRYYSKPVEVDKKTYYVCSQWYEKNRANLENWLDCH